MAPQVLSIPRRLAVLAGLAALGACAPTVPVVVKPIDCAVSAEVLARRCTAPQAITETSTYGEVLQSYLLDRKSLRDCAAHDQLLAEMILQCQATIKAYNDSLAEINRSIVGKP